MKENGRTPAPVTRVLATPNPHVGEVVITVPLPRAQATEALRAFTEWSPRYSLRHWSMSLTLVGGACWLVLQMGVPYPSPSLPETCVADLTVQTAQSLRQHLSRYGVKLKPIEVLIVEVGDLDALDALV